MEDKIFKGLCGLIMIVVALMGLAMVYDILFNKNPSPETLTVEYLGSYDVRKVCNKETNNCVCFSASCKKEFATFKCP